MAFRGKIAIVTGSSTGIGAATAIKLSAAGGIVCLTGRDEQKLKEVVEKCKSIRLDNGQEAIYVVGDITNETTQCEIVSKTLAAFGRLDILVNNAGIVVGSPADQLDMGQFDHCMNVNVRSVMQLTHLCLPHLKTSKGNVVNISSIASNGASKNRMFYCMSKAALDSYTRCLAQELGSFGVRVNSINPGFTKTDIHRRRGFSEQELDQFYEAGAQNALLCRVADPDEIADCILFLASTQASFVTGQTWVVDGGATLQSRMAVSKKT